MADIVKRHDAFRLAHRCPAPLGRLFRSLWEDFDDEIGEGVGLLRGRLVPDIDVREDQDKLVVTAELPGVSKDGIDMSVHGDTLTIKGEKRHEEETEEGGYRRRERCYGSFERTIRLPDYVDRQNIGATFKDGVLTLTLPKKEEVKPRTIKIKEG